MGLDISGYIECRVRCWQSGGPPTWWVPAMPLDLLYDNRDYDAFGCLFGVRNYTGFDPIAPYRGLPEDVSEQVREAAESSSIRSWIGWDEIQAIDWDERAPQPDTRLHEYLRQPDGTLRYVGKSAWSSSMERATGVGLEQAMSDGRPAWPEGTEWTDGDRVLRVETLRRRDAVPPDQWDGVWLVMGVLADRHGEECVRLVVWFD